MRTNDVLPDKNIVENWERITYETPKKRNANSGGETCQ